MEIYWPQISNLSAERLKLLLISAVHRSFGTFLQVLPSGMWGGTGSTRSVGARDVGVGTQGVGNWACYSNEQFES
jgi:hypothetical protein